MPQVCRACLVTRREGNVDCIMHLERSIRFRACSTSVRPPMPHGSTLWPGRSNEQRKICSRWLAFGVKHLRSLYHFVMIE